MPDTLPSLPPLSSLLAPPLQRKSTSSGSSSPPLSPLTPANEIALDPLARSPVKLENKRRPPPPPLALHHPSPPLLQRRPSDERRSISSLLNGRSHASSHPHTAEPHGASRRPPTPPQPQPRLYRDRYEDERFAYAPPLTPVRTPDGYYPPATAPGPQVLRPEFARRHSYHHSVAPALPHPPLHPHHHHQHPQHMHAVPVDYFARRQVVVHPSPPHASVPAPQIVYAPPGYPMYEVLVPPPMYDYNLGARAPISRTTKACDACRSRKVRCDAGAYEANGAVRMQCSRCRESGRVCTYSAAQKKRGPCPRRASNGRGTSAGSNGSASAGAISSSPAVSRRPSLEESRGVRSAPPQPTEPWQWSQQRFHPYRPDRPSSAWDERQFAPPHEVPRHPPSGPVFDAGYSLRPHSAGWRRHSVSPPPPHVAVRRD